LQDAHVGEFGSRVFFTSLTSTLNQRGVSGVALGSKYLFLGSNWVASGYAATLTSASPAMPGSAHDEW